MLFNSYVFIFVFLPLVLTGFFVLGRRSGQAAAAWLTFASIFFYGWWDVRYVPLLLASILVNFVAGNAIARSAQAGGRRKSLLVAAVVANLALLCYFKYASFLLDMVGLVSGAHLGLGHIVLPLGISFFTFTQIAYLVDAYQGRLSEPSLVHYGLFVNGDYFRAALTTARLGHKERGYYATEQIQLDVSVRLADGSIAYNKAYRERSPEEVAAVARREATATPVYSLGGFEHLDGEYAQLLEQLLGRLRRMGIEVVIFLAPYHPDAYSILVRPEGPYRRVVDAETRVRSLAFAQAVPVLGSYNPAAAQCGREEFFDSMHARPACIVRILRSARAASGSPSRPDS